MDKIWLKHYPPGVPAEIDYQQHGSIGELFEESVARYADRPAYYNNYNMGKRISFGDLDRLTRNFGAWLQGKGLARGARVAVMMPNCLQYPVCVFGALRAGYVVVNVNPLYTARELEHQLQDSGSEVIVILENFAHVLQQVIAKTPVKHVVIAALGDLLGVKGPLVNFVVRKVKKMVPRWEIAGAIALSKGAILLDRNILANLEQASTWLKLLFPNEVESVVMMYPGVLECAVIGVPDPHSGEVPTLFVVRKDPALTEAEIRTHCEGDLTGSKRPKYVEFRKELPKTNVGKILRRALRDEADKPPE